MILDSSPATVNTSALNIDTEEMKVLVDLTIGRQRMLCQLSYYDKGISYTETSLPGPLSSSLSLRGCVRKDHFR